LQRGIHQGITDPEMAAASSFIKGYAMLLAGNYRSFLIDCWLPHRPADMLLASLLILGIVVSYTPQVHALIIVFLRSDSIGT